MSVITDTLQYPLELLFSLFSMQFIIDNPVPFARFMYWILVFSLLFVGAQKVFDKSGSKNIAIVIAAVIATTAVYFTPSETILFFAVSSAGIINFLIMIAIITVTLFIGYSSKFKIVHDASRRVKAGVRVLLLLLSMSLLGIYASISKTLTQESQLTTIFDSTLGFVSLALIGMLIYELFRLIRISPPGSGFLWPSDSAKPQIRHDGSISFVKNLSKISQLIGKLRGLQLQLNTEFSRNPPVIKDINTLLTEVKKIQNSIEKNASIIQSHPRFFEIDSTEFAELKQHMYSFLQIKFSILTGAQNFFANRGGANP